jgi:hypothetical protein
MTPSQRRHRDSQLAQSLDMGNTLGGLFTVNTFSDSLSSPTATGVKRKSIRDRDENEVAPTTNEILAQGHKPNFTYKLKILLGYFQIGNHESFLTRLTRQAYLI